VGKQLAAAAKAAGVTTCVFDRGGYLYHGRVKALAVIGVQYAEIRLAKPHRPLQHRIEHRCKVARRGIDDLQDLGRRGLPSQCLVALRIARGKLPLQIGDKLLRID